MSTALTRSRYRPALTRPRYQPTLPRSRDWFLALMPGQAVPTFARFQYTCRDKKFEFLYWIYWIFTFIVLPLYGTLFPTAGFSPWVYRRGFNEAIGTLCFPFFILYGVSLCRPVLLACLLLWSAARGEVLQYLTRSALSRVESRHIHVFRLFTFPAFLSKTRKYTQDFIVPSNFHHNLDNISLVTPHKISLSFRTS